MTPKFTTLTSVVAPLPVPNVDTDQIIPAAYLRGTERQGLGAGLFAGWRLLPEGSEDPSFILNQEPYRGAAILLAGENFGCGSSREHAVWALAERGFRAVLCTRFADIFRANALKNGLLPVVIAPEVARELFRAAAAGPLTLTIDLEHQLIAWPGHGPITFELDAFSRHCLLTGREALDVLLDQLPEIAAYERRNPPRIDTWQAPDLELVPGPGGAR